MSIAHGLVVPASVLGQRVRVGMTTLANGVVHIGLALVLGRVFGLVGIACSTALSALVTTIPVGLALLTDMTPLTPRALWRDVLAPWLLRIMPCSLVALLAGWALANPAATAGLGRIGAALASVLAGGAAGLIYLVSMRPILRNLPLGPRMSRLLGALRLV
jgi:peptidoglycan biosynthesis protein MviN/MurJ (putative lipid II flippase)